MTFTSTSESKCSYKNKYMYHIPFYLKTSSYLCLNNFKLKYLLPNTFFYVD